MLMNMPITIARREFLAATGVAMGSAAGGQEGPRKIRTGILGVQHSHLSEKLKDMYNNADY